MRWSFCVLVAVLLPVALSEDAVLNEETKNWIASILPNNLSNRFESKDAGAGDSGTNADNTIDPGTAQWLSNLFTTVAPPKGTTVASPKETTVAPPKETTVDPNLNKFNDPNLEPDFNDSQVCVTDKGQNGLCVSIYQCKDGVIDNTTLIDLRDGTCPHYLQTCCLRSEARSVPDVPPLSGECGWGNPGASVFRTQDSENINRKTYADYGEYPWMVALLRASTSEEWKQSDYYGGGSLIHPSVVITAAHKVDWQMPSQIKCRAGEWDTQTTVELYPTQDRLVKKRIIHEEYYRTPAINDVALLFLESPFTLADAPHIGLACLAPSLPPAGTTCYSMGWGKDFLKKNKYAVILKKVQLKYVESNKCQAALQRTRLGLRYRLDRSHLCAGGEVGVDTCKGDGGSSLVCPIAEGAESSRYAVYGMVAFGVDCGTSAPGVYVNVPTMYSWVDSKMTQEGFGTSSYKY